MSENKTSDTLRLDLEKLTKALDRLEEALAQSPDNPLLIDGAIQRFEFSFELTWKAIKRALFEYEGLEIASPRQALQQAYAVSWIDDESQWVIMLKDRNLTSHTYKETLAQEIFDRLDQHYLSMRSLSQHLLSKRI